MIARFLFPMVAAFIATSAAATEISGRAEVIDGDTIAVQGFPKRIRIYGIDAPEGSQTCEDRNAKRYLCGPRSADALYKIIGPNGRVSCEEMDRDRYGRIVAVCKTSSGKDIGEEMVRQGWALEFVRYSDGRYADAEEDARANKRGMHSGSFVEPWEWRKARRSR
jgi:Micrococcal nuclease (thermonuclease) homologs